MAVKLSMVRTRTITSATTEGLDGNIADFLQSLREEQYIDMQFMTLAGGFAVLIIYTV